MTARWTDPAGHSWPVTGYHCTVCHLPMIPAGSNTHPNCQEADR